MKKSQKRQKRLVLVAMVLMIGLVAGMGAMTYSKYITQYNAPAQNATAAKWGFTVTANVDNLFGTDYKFDANNLAKVVADDGGVAVNAKTSAGDIVAPGTTGSMNFSISGKAEVLAKVVYTFALTNNISVGEYKPVKWTLLKGGVAVAGCENVELGTINTYLNEHAEYILPGGTLTSTYTLQWTWVLETGANDDEKATNNVRDTAIGLKAAEETYINVQNLSVGTKKISDVVADQTAWDAISISLGLTASISIEQVQEIPVTP